MKWFTAVTAAICGGLLMLCPIANAQPGNIHIGKVTVLPSMTVTETYDDNIFLGSGDNNTFEEEVDDWVTEFDPGVMLNYDITGRGAIQLGATSHFALYADNSDNDWQNFNLLTNVDYKAPAGFYLALRNVYTDAEDPYGNQNQFRTGVPTKRWVNNFRSRFGYELQKLYRVELRFNYYKQDYDEDRDFTQNYDQYEVGAGIYRKVLPKTWGFLRYHYGDRNYYSHPSWSGSTDDNDADHDWHRANVGLKWETSPKITGEVSFGYKWIQSANKRDIFGNKYDDPNSWIASSRVTYTPTEKTAATLRTHRNFQYTNGTDRQYYKDTGISIEVSQEILFDFLLNAGISFSKNDYNDFGRDDDLYGAKLGIDYLIRPWLTTGLRYEYQQKDSDSDLLISNFGSFNEYKDNRIGLFIRASY